MPDAVLFTPAKVKEYLDKCIEFWRKKKEEGCPYAHYYIDAFQSVRVSLFGETLPRQSSPAQKEKPKN